MFMFWYKRCDYCNVLIGHVAREGMELLSVGILKTEDCLGKQLIVVPFFLIGVWLWWIMARFWISKHNLCMCFATKRL